MSDQDERIKALAQEAADRWSDALAGEPFYLKKLVELPSFIADAIRTALKESDSGRLHA